MNMISVSKALGILSQSRFELGVEMINLTEATGTVLAEDLAAKVTLPPFLCRRWMAMQLKYQILNMGR